MPDNGIKLFASGGHKLPDALEVEVEQGVGASFTRPTGAAIGRVRDVPDAGSRYIAHLLASTPQPLAGLRVVVDCAYGAASAPRSPSSRRGPCSTSWPAPGSCARRPRRAGVPHAAASSSCPGAAGRWWRFSARG